MGLINNVNVNVGGNGNIIDTLSTYVTKLLKPNIVDGKNVLTQEMMSAANTKYVIKYDFTLAEDITVPANCILEFDGGSISAGSGENMDTITGNNTGINAGLVKIFDTSVTLAGTWNIEAWYPEWFGAKGNDDTFGNQDIFNHILNNITPKPIILSSMYNLTDIVVAGNHSFSVNNNNIDFPISILGKNNKTCGFYVNEFINNQSLIDLLYRPCIVDNIQIKGYYYDPQWGSYTQHKDSALRIKDNYYYARVTNCIISKFEGNGITVIGTRNAVISRNVLDEIFGQPILAPTVYCNSCVIDSNIIGNRQEYHPFLYGLGSDAPECVITNNILYNAITFAISIEQMLEATKEEKSNKACRNIIVSDNIVIGFAEKGIQVSGNLSSYSDKRTIISNNIVVGFDQDYEDPNINSRKIGILLNGAENVLIIGNSIYNCISSNNSAYGGKSSRAIYITMSKNIDISNNVSDGSIALHCNVFDNTEEMKNEDIVIKNNKLDYIEIRHYNEHVAIEGNTMQNQIMHATQNTADLIVCNNKVPDILATPQIRCYLSSDIIATLFYPLVVDVSNLPTIIGNANSCIMAITSGGKLLNNINGVWRDATGATV